MKKIVLIAVIACFAAVSAYAQTFTVEEVVGRGRAQRDAGGRMVDIRAGDVLNESITIRTAVGVTLVLSDGTSTFTIPAGRNGRVGDLVEGRAAAGGTVAHAETGAISRTAGQVPTASARANIVGVTASEEDDEEDE